MFYFPFGEMTITPLDFIAIIGLSFSREVVPFNDEACDSVVVRNIWFKDFLGVVAFVKSGCSTLL